MFYDNLKKECEKQGLKITPIVLECGGNKGSLSGWKKGASPNSDIVMKLSIRLNVPTDYLLFGEKNNCTKINADSSNRNINFSENTNFSQSNVYNVTGDDTKIAPVVPNASVDEKFSNIIEYIQNLPEREQWKAIFRLEDVLKEEFSVEYVKKNE